jgi:hypothetical protein
MKKIIFSIVLVLLILVSVKPLFAGEKETPTENWVYFTQSSEMTCYYFDPIEMYDENNYKVFVKYIYTEKGKATVIKNRKKKKLSVKEYTDFEYGIDAYLINIPKKGYTILTYTDYSSTGKILDESKDMLNKLDDPSKIKWIAVSTNAFMNKLFKTAVEPKITQ